MAFKIRTTDGEIITVRGQQVFGSDVPGDIQTKDFSDSDRSFTAVASVESTDRMGDVVLVSGWKLNNYRKNPVVMPFHNYRTLPVGRSLEEYVDGKRLMFRPQFAPTQEGATMFSLFKEKYLKGFSVGFIALKSEPIKDGERLMGTKFIEQELLEVSVAPVPAHPDALSEIKSLVNRGMLHIPQKYLTDDWMNANNDSTVSLELDIPLISDDLIVTLDLQQDEDMVTLILPGGRTQTVTKAVFDALMQDEIKHVVNDCLGRLDD